jgi:tetratricopeptide (TPR) repeat protein
MPRSVDFVRSWVARRRQLALVVPGLAALLTGLVLATLDGGFPPTVWYPAALFMLVLLTVAVIVVRPARPRSKLLVAGLCAYALFTVVAFLSIAWADAPGEAWQAANRVLVYGLVILLVTLQPWDRGTATVAVGLVGFGTAAIAVVLLVVGITSDDAPSLFLGGRLAEPAGYLNATANLWLIGFWPALHMATRRAGSMPSRAAALAAATVLLEVELLSQSRGAVIAFAAAALVYLVFTTARWPTLLVLATTIGLTALAFDPLVDVRDAARAADLGPALDRAVRAIALTAAGAFAIGAVAVLAGSRLRPELERRTWVPRAGNVALAGLALAGAVAVLVAIGNPGDWIDERWDDFKNSGYSRVESGRTRFTGGLGSSRYDFYRVALDQFEDRPLAGVGGDNFADAYVLERRTLEAPRHPHSLAFRILSQHGILGAVLFAAFLAAMTGAALQARRRGGREAGAVAAAAFAAFSAFFFHALGDWLWAFPALGALGLGMLGVAARIEEGSEDEPAARGQPLALGARIALAVVVLASAASLAAPGIAARYTAAAYEDFREDPGTALERLDRAADLNPLSDEPYVAQGVIEQRFGRPRAAVGPLRAAIERRPGNWFAHLELGLALAQLGRSAEAEASLRESARLNPRQPLVRAVLRRLRDGRRIDPVAVERELYRGLQDRLQATDPDAASHSESDER